MRLESPVSGIELAGGRVVEVGRPATTYTAPRHGDLVAAAARRGRDDQPASAGGGARRGPRTALPRLPHRRARRRRRRPVPGQLDLHPRAGRAGRPHPELPLLVALDGPGPGQGLRRSRVLLLRGRRPLDDGRRRARRARGARARAARPRAALEGRARLRDARAEGVPDLRRRLRGARGRRSARGSTGSRTSSRSGATGSTATTTRTTRC